MAGRDETRDMASHARSKKRSSAPRSLPRRFARPRGESDGPPAGVILGARRFDPLRATLVLSGRGGLTLPAELRRALAIEEGGELVVEATPVGLLLRPVHSFDVQTVESSDDARETMTALSRRHARRKVH